MVLLPARPHQKALSIYLAKPAPLAERQLNAAEIQLESHSHGNAPERGDKITFERE